MKKILIASLTLLCICTAAQAQTDTFAVSMDVVKIVPVDSSQSWYDTAIAYTAEGTVIDTTITKRYPYPENRNAAKSISGYIVITRDGSSKNQYLTVDKVPLRGYRILHANTTKQP